MGGEEICDNKRTRTALAPRSGGDSGAEKTTTLMLPSSAGTKRAFTSVLFSYMLRSPLRSEGVFHSSMPCARDAAAERSI